MVSIRLVAQVHAKKQAGDQKFSDKGDHHTGGDVVHCQVKRVDAGEQREQRFRDLVEAERLAARG
jgi:hypothetical protein